MTRLALALLALILSGCASMSGKPPVQTISVQTVKDHKEVTEAGCIIKNGAGRWFVTTPGRVTINKNVDDLTVECSKEDVGSGREVIESQANMGLWGNAVFGGPVGYLIDRKSGAGYDYPQTVVVVLKKEAPVQEETTQPAQSGQAEVQIAPAPAEAMPAAATEAPAQIAAPTEIPPESASIAAAPQPAPAAPSSAPAWTPTPASEQAWMSTPGNEPVAAQPPVQAAAPAPQLPDAQAPAPAEIVQPPAAQTAAGTQPAWQTPSPEPETHYYQQY